jgi:hypothetical protein
MALKVVPAPEMDRWIASTALKVAKDLDMD